MTNLLGIVEEYYRRIDAGDIAWVVDMFASDGVYDRAGEIYSGRDAIRAFYSAGRKIKVRHSDIRLWACGRDMFVEGSFSGTGADGSKREGQFSDHWTFNDEGKVTLRRTSLFTGSRYIKE